MTRQNMTAVELRAHLEAIWDAHGTTIQGDLLRELNIPVGDLGGEAGSVAGTQHDGISWLGGERIAERLQHWAEKDKRLGVPHPLEGDELDDERAHNLAGAFWFDGLITGVLLERRCRALPYIQPTDRLSERLRAAKLLVARFRTSWHPDKEDRILLDYEEAP